jgi:hypothetical protein
MCEAKTIVEHTWAAKPTTASWLPALAVLLWRALSVRPMDLRHVIGTFSADDQQGCVIVRSREQSGGVGFRIYPL